MKLITLTVFILALVGISAYLEPKPPCGGSPAYRQDNC
jgi:hypothetical protein